MRDRFAILALAVIGAIVAAAFVGTSVRYDGGAVAVAAAAGGVRDGALLTLDKTHPQQPGRAVWRSVGGDERLSERVVLLVHGLDEPGSIWDDLGPTLDEAGYAAVRFEYPNDQHIGASADLLYAALRDLRSRGVERVDIVAHSMGGLVSADCLTRESLCGGRVEGTPETPAIDRLITVGTPWLGAPMANMQAVSEVREQVMRWYGSGGASPRGALDFLRDGAGEAGDDLLPGSAFLVELRSRAWPPALRRTVIYGEMGGDDARALHAAVDDEAVRGVTRFLGFDEAAAGIEAWSARLGDGVVPVDSACGSGAEDTVRLAANHRLMLKCLPGEHDARKGLGATPAVAPAIPVVLDRLGRSSSPPDPLS